MTRYLACLALAATLAPIGGPSLAADMPPEIVMPELAAAPPSQGWYIRADLGYPGWTGDEDPTYRVFGADGLQSSDERFDSTRFSKPFSYGAGIGYQFSEMLRADVTADGFNGRLSGTSDIAARCSGTELLGTSCGYDHAASYRGIGVLGNAYVDLGTFAGFTPYLGAGAGATRISWGSTRSTPFCIDGSDSCSGAAYGGSTFGGEQSWRFTYAFMAGISYDISSRVKFDLGYRYSDVAGGDMFGYGADEAGYGATGAKGRDHGLSRHEIRAGLRVSLW